MSKTFVDKLGREHTLHINLVALSRLRVAGVTLESIVPMPNAKNVEGALIELSDLLHGSITAVNAAVAILSPSLEKAGITHDEFLESIDDESVMTAIGMALYEAIVDFFQKSPLRQAMVKQAWKRGAAMMAKSAAAMERYADRVADRPEPTEAEIDAMIAKTQHPGKSSATASPELSALNHHPK